MMSSTAAVSIVLSSSTAPLAGVALSAGARAQPAAVSDS
jgi:hypothetical protein